ncbi:Multidrug resistance-associated protein 1 [Tolypocladium ophioglossoides CBS 100239]|uniref:Multidrug resistance-associated protein 1 n=1 Tax=Tolypocladium ophioglossoides (strain CBS 100239) TaxID=1163406 RepID=A0A0L0NDR7_TOLOC|nr:Multidrug resistance-associated protein 1 [Tolypocladium ophioglossoides CBS 100239]
MSQTAPVQQLLSPFCPDDTFGPWAGYGCRAGFDFTLLFEESILTIPLQCLLLVALPIRVFQLLKSDVQVRFSLLLPIKAVCSLLKRSCITLLLLKMWERSSLTSISKIATVALLSVNAALLGLWATTSDDTITHTRASIATAALVLVASIAATLLQWLEHERSLRPSFVLTIYFFFSILLDLPRARTLWMLGSYRLIPVLYICSLVMKAVALFLESWEKRDILISGKNYSFETTSGTLSRSVFWWLMPIFREGFKRNLTLDDMYPLDDKLRAEPVLDILEKAWEKVPNRLAPGALMNAWVGAFAPALLAPIFPRLCVMGFTYAQPFLIKQAVGLAATPNAQPYNNWGTGGSMRDADCHSRWQDSPNVDSERWSPSLIHLTVVVVATIFISIPTGQAQADWIQASQDRVTATSKTLGSIKWLKVSGLNDLAFSMIRRLRARELTVSMRFRLLLGSTMVMLVLVPIWSPILTFSMWAGIAKNEDNPADLAKIFAAYSLIVLLNSPLTTMLVALPVIAGSIASFQRIQNHLNGRERQDNRISLLEQRFFHSLPSPNMSVFAIPDSMLVMTPQNEDEFELEYMRPDTPSTPTPSQETDVIASVQGTFSWTHESEPCLNITSWIVRRGSLNFVVGPVGCGKSTLLKSLLGELSAFDGIIRTEYSGVTYCDQIAWVPNECVRDIITGRSKFEEDWYQQVIKACALEEDLRNWSHGDQTVAGTSGISMSGGQKHRLAIARAVYSRREFLVFDDVLSGLDAATENRVFTNLFAHDGLLRSGRRTIVMATSSIARLSYADQIVSLSEKGHLMYTGTPDELRGIMGFADVELTWEANAAPKKLSEEKERPAAARAILDAPKLEEDKTRRLGDSSMYSFYAVAAGRTTLLILAVAMGLYAFCSAFPTVWIGWWADAMVDSLKVAQNPFSDLGKWLGVYVALGVGAIIAVGTGI